MPTDDEDELRLSDLVGTIPDYKIAEALYFSMHGISELSNNYHKGNLKNNYFKGDKKRKIVIN